MSENSSPHKHVDEDSQITIEIKSPSSCTTASVRSFSGEKASAGLSYQLSRKDLKSMRMYEAYWVFVGLSEATGSDYLEANAETNMERVGIVASNGDPKNPLFEPRNVLKLLKYYKEKFGITTLEQFHVKWGWVCPPKLDRDLTKRILQEHKNMIKSGTFMPVMSRVRKLRSWIKWALENTHDKKLVASHRMWAFFSERVKLSYDLYILIVQKVLTLQLSEAESRKLVFVPQPNDIDVDIAIKRLKLLLDLAIVGNLVGLKTLLSPDCYRYLGRPFGKRGDKVITEHELQEYRSVVYRYMRCHASNQLADIEDPLSKVRVKKDMVILARDYGDRFQRKKIVRTNEDYQDFLDQESFVAIFHCLCHFRSDAISYSGAISKLVQAGLINVEEKRVKLLAAEFIRHMREQSMKKVMRLMNATELEYKLMLNFLEAEKRQ